MCREDLYANRDQDQSAGDFHTISHFFVQFRAKKDPRERKSAGDEANGRAWPPDVGSQKGKAEPDSESVEAGGHGKRHQGEPARGVAPDLLGARGHACVDHPPPYDYKKQKGKPVINRLDKLLQLDGQEPPEDGHQELEQTEMKREPEGGSPSRELAGRPRPKSHSESIHGKAAGDDQYFQ